MAKGFSQTYKRRVGRFKVRHSKILNEAAELMIQDHIKNIEDEKTPSRRPQRRNTRKTLERKGKKGYGSKPLVERRKSLQSRVGWAKDIRVNNRGGSVTVRPNKRRLSDEAVNGLLGLGYDFIGTSKSALNRIGKIVAKETQAAFRRRRVKKVTIK